MIAFSFARARRSRTQAKRFTCLSGLNRLVDFEFISPYLCSIQNGCLQHRRRLFLSTSIRILLEEKCRFGKPPKWHGINEVGVEWFHYTIKYSRGVICLTARDWILWYSETIQPQLRSCQAIWGVS